MCYKRRQGIRRRAHYETCFTHAKVHRNHMSHGKVTPLFLGLQNVLSYPPGGQLTSSGYNAVALPPFGTDDQQTWEQALHYIEHVLGVTPLPQGLWQDTCEWNQLKSACQAGSTDTDHDKTESLLYRWFIRLPPPHNDRFECQVPVNDDRSAYCKATMHKKWRILSHIRSHLQYRPFACNGQCGVPTWYASSSILPFTS